MSPVILLIFQHLVSVTKGTYLAVCFLTLRGLWKGPTEKAFGVGFFFLPALSCWSVSAFDFDFLSKEYLVTILLLLNLPLGTPKRASKTFRIDARNPKVLKGLLAFFRIG